MTDPFSIKSFKFPKDFIWGSATAGHQIEGDNVNSGHYYGELKSIEVDPKFELSGKACNSYNMWREDVDILSELGHQMYRMSIEWSRIEPVEGEFQISEVNHYLEILNALKEKGIKVCITLVHFTTPRWFSLKGGFKKQENIVYFEKYLEYLLPKISHLVDLWCVMNEFNLLEPETKLYAPLFHARAYHIIKKYSDKPVSSAHALINYKAKRQWDAFDRSLRDSRDAAVNEYWFHAVRTGEILVNGFDALYSKELKDTCDYWAVNSYVSSLIDSRKVKLQHERYSFERIDMISDEFYMNKLDPECMVHNLTRLMDKPVYITENGCCSDDDRFRVVFLVEYLAAINEAIRMGVDVKGFLYWSLLDNYEWRSFLPQFGLVEVDRAHDFKRTIKPSAYFLRDIIQNNGYDMEMLKKYLKEIPQSKHHLDY